MYSKDERLNCERQTLQDKCREFQKLLIIKTYTAGKVERARYSRKEKQQQNPTSSCVRQDSALFMTHL